MVGTERDLNGVRRHVRVTELRLAAIIFADMLNPGEVTAAADALFAGDPRPLLRMGAENPFLWPGPEGDPAGFSSGAFAAAFCNDMDTVWEPDDTIPTRRQEVRTRLRSPAVARLRSLLQGRHLAALPARAVSRLAIARPVHARGAPRFDGSGHPGAAAGSRPGPQRADRDQPQHQSRVPPGGSRGASRGRSHRPAGWSYCARDAKRFTCTLRTGSTVCPRTPAFTVAAPASFPRRADDAAPAHGSSRRCLTGCGSVGWPRLPFGPCSTPGPAKLSHPRGSRVRRRDAGWNLRVRLHRRGGGCAPLARCATGHAT